VIVGGAGGGAGGGGGGLARQPVFVVRWTKGPSQCRLLTPAGPDPDCCYLLVLFLVLLLLLFLILVLLLVLLLVLVCREVP